MVEGCKEKGVSREGLKGLERSFWGRGSESLGKGPGNGQRWRKDGGTGGMGISGECGSQEGRKSAGDSPGSGVQVLTSLCSPAVKPWKPRWTLSAKCRTPGPAPGPDPGPTPALVLAPDPRGAADGRRGAHEVSQPSPRMEAPGQEDRPCGSTVGTCIEVPTLDEMPS